MIGALIIFMVGIFAAVIFLLRYFVGVVTFWGKPYLKQGYQILSSNRTDFYLLDSAVLYSLAVLYLYVRRYRPSFAQIGDVFDWKWLLFLGLLVLLTWPFRKSGVFYHEQGLLVVRPLKKPRPVPWEEIGNIRKWRLSPKFHSVLDPNGRRLARFSLNRKTRRFLALAEQKGIPLTTAKWL